LDPGTLDRIVSGLDIRSHPDLIVGLATPDDAGVFRITEKIALIQTLDFLTPVTDDPYEFGQIAAANSLSDVYAMGGTPVTVMNIVCFPSDLPEQVLAQTLKGGQDKINEAGAVLVGGHSVDDPEFKYGLSVTGTVHPDKVLTNSNARVGDAIILTKPIGTGIMSTAIKGKLAEPDHIRESVAVMSYLNRYAAEVMEKFEVNACTDVTGFGLAGHLVEMARGAKKHLTLFSGKVPLLKDVLAFANMGLVPAGAHKNRAFFKNLIRVFPGMDRALSDLMFDPQTSGGLVISLRKKDASSCVEQMEKKGISAWIIGEVSKESPTGFLDII
jgi:selenide, water dikinase